MWYRIFLVVALVACGAKSAPDPLAAQRAALAAHTTRRLPFSAHASLAIDPSITNQLMGKAIDTWGKQLLSRPFRGPMGLQLQAETVVQRHGLDLASGACPRCLDLDLTLVGATRVGLDGPLAQIVPWQLSVGGKLAFEVAPRGVDRVVTMRPTEPWRATSKLDQVPTALRDPASRSLQQAIHQSLVDLGLTGPLDLVRIPHTWGLQLRDLSLRADPAFRVDAMFEVLQAGAVSHSPDPQGGWALAVSEKTLLGLVQAALLRRPVHKRFAAEATGLSLDDNQVIQVDLRVWRAQKKPAYRDYRITTEVQVLPSTLALTPSVVEVGRSGRWGGLAGLAGKKLVANKLRKSLTVVQPQ